MQRQTTVSTFRVSLGNEVGSTSLETALGLLPFTLILFGLLQMLAFAHSTMSMHFALSKAARWGVLNQTITDSNGTMLNRVGSIKQYFREVAPLYGVNPDAVTLRICPVTVPECTVESAAGGGRSFIIHAERPARFLTGFTFLQPRTSIVITNEPHIGS